MGITRRGRIVGVSLGALLVIGGGVTARQALSVSDVQSEPVTSNRAVEIPLFAPRRAPQYWRAAVADDRLTAGLQGAIPSEGACAAVSIGHRLVGAVDPDASLAPASTMKILTAIAALDLIGPDHRFTTELRGVEPDADGVVAGPVVMVGGGDPTLATPRYIDYLAESSRFRTTPVTPLDGFVDQLVDRGVTRIDGPVLGESGRYFEPAYLETWKPNYRSEGQVGPIAALNVNHGFGDLTPPSPVDDPAGYAARQLEELLVRSSIDVDAGAAAPAGTGDDLPVLAVLESPPLRDIVAAMLTSSDNTVAEMLTREIAIADERAATTPEGVAAIVEVMTEYDIDRSAMVPLDGSGLSPEARLTCRALLDAVEVAPDVVDDGYPDAAESGTLAVRWVGTELAGIVHAKTGQLNGVVGLAGVLDGTEVRPEIRFAFLAGGSFSQEQGQDLQTAMVTALLGYPVAPTLDGLWD